MITEPLISDRLYGGILERIVEEVDKIENEKLVEEGDHKKVMINTCDFSLLQG